MSYGLLLSPLAERQLGAQPEPLQAFLFAMLERLAQRPSAVSRRSSIRGPGQIAEFKFDREGVSVWVRLVFLYG